MEGIANSKDPMEILMSILEGEKPSKKKKNKKNKNKKNKNKKNKESTKEEREPEENPDSGKAEKESQE